ncbi:MAG: T9SS type A sorting domain-containing protein [Flavobacteriales bacterium]|nr:T9SS type A sorting domain-containing protein [Flavobacteriales bacterium]
MRRLLLPKILSTASVALLSAGVSAQVLFNEAFTGGASSTGFTIMQTIGTTTWVYGDPGARYPGSFSGAGFDADFAMFDSDDAGSGGGDAQASLVSAAFDASAAGTYTLDFDQSYQSCCGSTADVEVWDGSTWNNVLSQTTSSVGYPAADHQTIDISAAAGGSSTAQVRFTYHGDWAWWWALDNISVTYAAPASYCSSNFSNVNYEFITNVDYAGISNPSIGVTGGPSDYTAQVATVTQGGSDMISVTIDPDMNDYVYVFIDWDQNGTLDDPGEVYTLATATSSAGPHTMNINVPVGASPGNTRMRVMVDYNNATPDPCRIATYGEAEDYTVNVLMPVSYCSSNFSNVTYEFVTNVDYAGISNPSVGVIGGPSDYTAQVATVTQGGSDMISVTIDPDANDYVYVFIDWDQNGTLDDPGEVYTLATATSSAGPHTMNINVPVGASPGNTRMRVMVDYNNATPDPCRIATYGEAEDYTVNVLMGGGCVGTPAPGSATTPVAICPGSTAVLTATGADVGVGITYQWEESPDGLMGWAPVGDGSGETTTSYTTGPVVGTRYYRMAVTCSMGGTDYTNVVTVDASSATPFPEDFSSGTLTDNCWSSDNGTYLTYDAASAYGMGTGSARWNFYNASDGTEMNLTSPAFAALVGGEMLSFDVAGATYTGGEVDHIIVEESNDGGSNWTTVVDMDNDESPAGLLNTGGAQGGSFTPTSAQWSHLTYALSAGTNRVRFRGVSNFGNRCFVDNINLLTCTPPMGTLALDLTNCPGSLGVTVNVTSLGDAGSVMIEYTVNPPNTPVQIGPFGTGPQTITGLNFGDEVAVTLLHDADAACDQSLGSIILPATCPPDNDNCDGAIELTVGLDGDCPANATTATTESSTESPEGEPSCDTGLQHGDVWFWFDSGMNTTINWNFTQGTTNISIVDLFEGTCPGGLTEVDCAFNFGDISDSWTVTPMTTYYVRVSYSYDFDTPGTFDICLSAPPPPPANDLCDDAIAVSCNSVTSGTTINATADDAPGTCTTGLSTAGGVWYTVTGWGGQMTASLCGADYDTKIGVFTGNCGGLTCVIGNDDDLGTDGAEVCGGGLASSTSWASVDGVVYHIYVTGFSTNTGNFDLEISCGDSNPACTDNSVTVDLMTDGAGAETSWEIVPFGLSVPVCSGSGYSDNMNYMESCCLPDGDYVLTFFDSMGDGMSTGGYRLLDGNNERIIDNWNDGVFGSTSSTGRAFHVPLGTDHVIFGDCDREDWQPTEFIVASPNAAVSAEWGVGDQTDDGYQFWFSNPDGGYNRLILRNHATSGGYGPAGPTRACHLRLNSMVTLPLPYDVLLNVRVRSLVNGVYSAFGPACRFMMPSTPPSCPTTMLIDNPNNPNYSCGVERVFGGSDKVYCYPVSGANKYRWSFRNSDEGFLRNIASNNAGLVLNWVTLPLVDGGQYWVLVQASFDNGANYCPFGDSCMVTINNAAAALSERSAMVDTEQNINLFPNPNNGDQVYLTMNDLPEGVENVSVEMFDMYGKRVMSTTLTGQDGMINSVMYLDRSLASGLYTVNLTAGDHAWTQRLMINK